MALPDNPKTEFQFFINGNPVNKVISDSLVPKKPFRWIRNIFHKHKSYKGSFNFIFKD